MQLEREGRSWCTVREGGAGTWSWCTVREGGARLVYSYRGRGGAELETGPFFFHGVTGP